MPQKYRKLAQKENHYLIFILVDLAAEQQITAGELHDALAKLHRSGALLSLGILRRAFTSSPESLPRLPYYLILQSAQTAETLIETLRLNVLFFDYFWRPSAASSKATEKTPGAERHAAPHELHVRDSHLKVSLELLNTLIDLTGEIVLTRNALVRRVGQTADASLGAWAKKLSYLVSDLQDKVMKTRLQKLDMLFHRFPRLARETAQLTGKKVELQIEGGALEIDKAIIDEIADPLLHVVRNAVDHGIEFPEERLTAGKPEMGKILVNAELREGNIVIKVADDGRGLDLAKIREAAVAKGLISPDRAVHATAAEITEYLFLPGFSTKSEVTTVSGRGVGMDVVRTNVQKLGGCVEISGELGRGSVVTLVIPQTLSILTCLIVEIEGFRFVIPQQNIVEIITPDPSRLRQIQNKTVYELRQQLLPIVETAELFEIAQSDQAMHFIVVVRAEKYRYGLRVQTVHDTEEVVVKPLPQFGQERQIFSGAAIMGDGRIAPILDAALLARQANLTPHSAERQIGQARELIAAWQYLLFRVYGQNVALHISALPRIEKIDSSAVRTIVGRKVAHCRNELIPILPLDFLQSASENPNELNHLLILCDEGKKYGLLVGEIIDIVSEESSLRRAMDERSEILGYTLIRGETTLVLDAAALMRQALQQETTALPGVTR